MTDSGFMADVRITMAHRTAVVPKARPTRSMLGLDGSGLVAVKAFLLTTGEKKNNNTRFKIDRHVTQFD